MGLAGPAPLAWALAQLHALALLALSACVCMPLAFAFLPFVYVRYTAAVLKYGLAGVAPNVRGLWLSVSAILVGALVAGRVVSYARSLRREERW